MSEASTAWMLVATAFVLLMTPALGFFYGGLVRSKSALNTMMMSIAAIGFVGLAWALLGYTLAFGTGSDAIGDLSFALLYDVDTEAQGAIPHVLFMAFQGTFAVITAALISGAIVDRMRFGAYLLFITLWAVLIYAPLAHWVWGGGWLFDLGALDFAGGTVVHINAGVAALVAALVLGARHDYGTHEISPHNIPFTLLGAAMLWLGWFGFNGGSALAANAAAALAIVNTMVAPMATLVVWMLLDMRRTGKATAVGAATGIVVGLVAITPAAGFVSPLAAIAIGAISAFPSYVALIWRSGSALDDSLDVFAAHGVGGISGALLTGVFADASWNGTVDGLLYGNPGQLADQAIAVAAAIAFSAGGTLAILKALNSIMPLRVSSHEEGLGLDLTQHGERAYAGAAVASPGAHAPQRDDALLHGLPAMTSD